MAVTIQHLEDQATFEHGLWTSADARFAALLNALMRTRDLSPSVGRVDVFCAEAAVRVLGGDARIVLISPEHLPDDAVP